MKKRTLSFVGLVIFFCIVFSGCNKSTKKDAQQEVIKIGAVLPLTGDLAYIAEPIMIATDIAIQEINEGGGINGRKIEVKYEDSKGSPKEGVNAVKKLIEMDNINIITTFLSGVSEACKYVTEDANALLLAQTVSTSICDNSNLTVRFHYSFTEEGDVLKDFIIRKKPSRVFFINSSDPSTSFVFDSLIIADVKKDKLPYIQEKFNVGNKDFKTIATKVKQSNCDVIALAGYGNDIAILLRDLYNVGITTKTHTICGNIGFIEIPENVNTKLYEGTIFTMPPFMLSANNKSKVANFIDKYKKTSGYQQIGYAAYYAYDLIKILGSVMNEQKTIDVNELKEALFGKHEGIGGIYNIKKSGDVVTEVVLGTFYNNQIEQYIIK